MSGIIPVIIQMNIDVGGTQEQVTSNANIKPSSVIFAAPKANAGLIYVGLSDCSATKFIAELSPGQSFSISSDNADGRLGTNGIQLSSLYVNAVTNNDDCNVTYIYPQGQ